MARKVATLLLLVFDYCMCMEMRETVERTVMVRTMGSDLQPAATGYIYKKESDGPVSVTKIGESEVLEHLTKLYDSPNTLKESTTREFPIHTAATDPTKTDSYSSRPHSTTTYVVSGSPKRDSASQASVPHISETDVKPVVEPDQEKDKIDGIANEEFYKLFEDYIKNSNKHKNNFDDYLPHIHGLGHYDHSIYHGHGQGDKDDYGLIRYGYGDHDLEENSRYHQYETEPSNDDYIIGDHGRYFMVKDKDQKGAFTEINDHGRHYFRRHKSKNDDHTHDSSPKKSKKVDGFHEGIRLDEYKKDNDFHDRQTFGGANNNNGRHGHDRSDASGYESRDAHRGHDDEHFRTTDNLEKASRDLGDKHSSEHSSEESADPECHSHRNFALKGKLDTGESYRYEIKH